MSQIISAYTQLPVPRLLPPAHLFRSTGQNLPAPVFDLSPLPVSPAAGSALPVVAFGAAPGNELAQRIAHSAESVAMGRDTVGSCYEAVAEAIEMHIPPFLWGMSAWMAADQLAASPAFKELPVAPEELAGLPAGTVVVWEQGTSPHGHISVALGDGREASDHLAPQMNAHYGGGRPRAFLPQPV